MILNIQSLDGAQELDSDLPSIDLDVATAPPSLKFHGTKPPSHEIQRERAIHRTAAYMAASGAKIKTIAFELGVAEGTVSNWFRQDWFQQSVAVIIHNEFSDDISKLLKAGAVESVMIIRDIATNGTSETNKLKAAQDLLDRYRGKATNFVHHTGGALNESPEVEMKRLENELKLTENKS